MSAADYYHRDNRLGGSAYKHGPDTETERIYDNYREQARQASKAGDFNGMKRLNKLASDYIFEENNAVNRVKDNELDLHGQFVHEAEDRLRVRLETLEQEGRTGVLHVIVGKGNHSPGHIQKIKPAVEHLCAEKRLQFETEPNEGRIRVHYSFAGGMPTPGFVPSTPYQPSPHHQSPQHGGSPHFGSQAPHQSPHFGSPGQHQSPQAYGSPHSQGQTPWGQSPQQQSPGFAGFPGQSQGGYQGSPHQAGFPGSPQQGYTSPGIPNHAQQNQYSGPQNDDPKLTEEQKKMAKMVVRKCMNCCSVM